MPGGPSRGASARNTSSESVSARAVGGRPVSATARAARSRPQRGVSAFTSVFRRDVNPAEATRSASSAPAAGACGTSSRTDDLTLGGGEKSPRETSKRRRAAACAADVEGQEPERVPAGRRDDAVRDFLLDHDDEAREEVRPPHERAQHRRGALVREVADEGHGRRRSDPGQRLLDVGMEGVLRLDEKRPLRELQREAGREHGVDLEGQDPDAPVEERPGERAAPRTHLDDGFPLPRPEAVENFFDGGRVYEEVLTPASPRGSRA